MIVKIFGFPKIMLLEKLNFKAPTPVSERYYSLYSEILWKTRCDLKVHSKLIATISPTSQAVFQLLWRKARNISFVTLLRKELKGTSAAQQY